MRKAAIIMITAFYLLLTTGMYVCLLACASEALVAKPLLQMFQASSCKANHNRVGQTEKAHPCCANHGSFVIRENLVQAAELQFAGGFAMINPLLHYYSAVQPIFIDPFRLAADRTIAWQSGKSRSIRLRSIQI